MVFIFISEYFNKEKKMKRTIKWHIRKTIANVLSIFNFNIYKLFPRHFQKYNLISKPNLIGVEIGVLGGKNARSLLKYSDVKMLYLVDSYEGDYGIGQCGAYSQKRLDKESRKAKRRLRKYEDKITWIRKKSEDAINLIPNNLDFVYIDANHFYDFVKKDIEMYYPKLKEGGLLAGDDFPRCGKNRDSDVNKAVLEFIKKENLGLFTSLGEFWIIKNDYNERGLNQTQPKEDLK